MFILPTTLYPVIIILFLGPHNVCWEGRDESTLSVSTYIIKSSDHYSPLTAIDLVINRCWFDFYPSINSYALLQCLTCFDFVRIAYIVSNYSKLSVMLLWG